MPSSAAEDRRHDRNTPKMPAAASISVRWVPGPKLMPLAQISASRASVAR